MRQLPPAPVFSRADALACGWNDAALARAVRDGRIVRLRHGCFTTLPPGSRVTALAAARACKGAVISHESALIYHGLPLLGAEPIRPHLTVPPWATGDLKDASLSRASMGSSDIVEIDGAEVTSVARTLLDVGRRLSVARSVAAIDAALNRRLVTPDEIDDVMLRCWNWPGIRRAQRAFRLSDARAESPLESVSRLVIGWLRLPEPELQVEILDDEGHFIGRLDFYWDEFGVGGEADGLGKYEDRTVLTREKIRQELLEDTALVCVRWGWAEVTRTPRLFGDRCQRGFERGRRRDRSGLPRRWTLRRT